MTPDTASDVRRFIVEFFSNDLLFNGIDPRDLADDMDLLEAGVIDSMSVLELTVALEERFDVEIDFEELPADQLVAVGPLSAFVASQADQRSG